MAARDTVDWMREQLPRAPGVDAQIDVGGPTALIKDFDDRVSATQPLVFVFVALIAFVMLLISIRSVFLAFKGVLMTVLSVAAAYGSLVVVFQWGWLEALGFKPISSLDSTIPPLVLAMTFGLSMDYEIFLLTRIRERFLQTNNTRDAVAYGVSTSARTITSAALIMIAVFIGFAFAGMPLVAQLGVACAVAIAVDATVVRLVLVPALMAMFDEWNWWLPRWLARILPSVDFEKPLPKVDIGDLVIIPDDISTLGRPGSDLRMVVKSAAKLKTLAPDTITVADPLAFSGCLPAGEPLGTASRAATSRCRGGVRRGSTATHPNGRTHHNGTANRNGKSLTAAAPGASGHHVAGPAVGRAGRPGRPKPTPPRTDGTQQPDGNHQRPTAHRRPAADPDRRGDAAVEELPDHVPKQRPGLRRVCRIGRLHGDSNRCSGAGRNGPVLLWSTVEERSGWPPSWCAAWPTRSRRTSTTPGCRAPRRRPIGPRSGSAACRWR